MQSLFLLSLFGAAFPEGNRRGKPYFSTIFLERPSRWPAFLSSLGVHAVLLVLVPLLSQYLAPTSDRESEVRKHRLVRTLHIRVPEQFYIASGGSRAPNLKPPKKLFDPLREKGRGASRAALEAAKREEQRRAGRRRPFELPPLKRRPETAQTILQPQYSPELPAPSKTVLPEVFFWAPQPSPSGYSPFLTPGHVTPPTQARILDATPKLEIPISERAMMSTQAMPDSLNALLLVAPAPALPIQTSESDTLIPRTGISADPSRGDPATLLALSLLPPRMREFLAVPPGNIVGRLPDGSLSGGGGNGDGTNGPNGKGDGGRASGGAGASGDAANGLHAGAGSAAAGGGTTAGLTPLGAAAVAAAASTRILHPVGGVFDVVIQSGDLEAFPESAGILSGKPVYSVFVRAGTTKDWILQYCVPAGEDTSVEISGPVVRLGSSSAVSAPYPHVTMRPPIHQRPGYLMVHGFIGPEGKFQDIRIVGKSEPQEQDMVLPVLEQWEFRPAMRENQPVRVEILLAIPTE